MNVKIRPFHPDEYDQIAAVLAAARPETAVSAELLQYRDQTRPAICQSQRFVAVRDGLVVGFSFYTQYADMFEPNAYWVDVCISPLHRKQGIGTALFTRLRQSLWAKRPFTLRVQIKENNRAGIRFAEKHGFQEFGRRWESRLSVAEFDEIQFPDFTTPLAAKGIHIVPFTDLADDPARDRKLYALQTELDQDVPMLVPVTPMTFAQFADQVLHNPSLVADGLMVATHGDAYVGMSSFFESGSHSLVIDLTGTRKPYRRQGIAIALKLAGILFARRRGYETIIVHNDVVNRGMLAVNDKLGFVRQPAMIQYALDYRRDCSG